MPRRELDALLHDVHVAGERILEATRGITFEQYGSEWMRRAAVERQFGIIGEAINEMLKQDGTLADRIKSADRIIAFPQSPDPRIRKHRRLNRMGHHRKSSSPVASGDR